MCSSVANSISFTTILVTRNHRASKAVRAKLRNVVRQRIALAEANMVCSPKPHRILSADQKIPEFPLRLPPGRRGLREPGNIGSSHVYLQPSLSVVVCLDPPACDGTLPWNLLEAVRR
nr:hypothetical protein CFP56_30216 [Quercus suber]